VQLLRRTGGMMPTAEDVVQAIKKSLFYLLILIFPYYLSIYYHYF
jgi:hypothetical protein